MSTSTTEPTTATSTGSRTAADKLWAALRAHPGSTTEQLAVHAGIGQSTAGKILASWVADATVTRTPTVKGRRNYPALFTIAETTEATDDGPVTDEVPAERPTSDADTDTDGQTSEPTAAPAGPTGKPGPATGTGKSPRLAAGGLRGMVEDYLRERPEQTFGPTAIGRHLGRSSGAVANALDRLVADGYAVMTSPKPKRYAYANRPETS